MLLSSVAGMGLEPTYTVSRRPLVRVGVARRRLNQLAYPAKGDALRASFLSSCGRTVYYLTRGTVDRTRSAINDSLELTGGFCFRSVHPSEDRRASGTKRDTVDDTVRVFYAVS
jgi:hypothetical protein